MFLCPPLTYFWVWAGLHICTPVRNYNKWLASIHKNVTCRPNVNPDCVSVFPPFYRLPAALAHEMAATTGYGPSKEFGSRWNRLCLATTHKDANCRRRRRDKVKQAVDEEDHTFAFKVQDATPVSIVRMKGLMVDSGATKHIITDEEKFVQFDPSFQPHSHILELADGERASGIALKKGTAKPRSDHQKLSAFLRRVLIEKQW